MSILAECRRVAKLLQERQQKLVLAESCTAGLVAASLSRVPGISSHLCGSMVTYRNEEKAAWLGISPTLLKKPGPVSEIVARKMVAGVLSRTAEATLVASVTGHLGPNAPPELDGVVYLAVAFRSAPHSRLRISVTRHICRANSRGPRQREVVERLLQLIGNRLKTLPPDAPPKER